MCVTRGAWGSVSVSVVIGSEGWHAPPGLWPIHETHRQLSSGL
jgi:hypothetical protein